ncbi:MAG: hypothetical protein SV186_05260 [Candidatus Nanohaloarchaea archaeon]|nr:hypothetical protein [Candidatus Nanohaloarchaea archaeon]
MADAVERRLPGADVYAVEDSGEYTTLLMVENNSEQYIPTTVSLIGLGQDPVTPPTDAGDPFNAPDEPPQGFTEDEKGRCCRYSEEEAKRLYDAIEETVVDNSFILDVGGPFVDAVEDEVYLARKERHFTGHPTAPGDMYSVLIVREKPIGIEFRCAQVRIPVGEIEDVVRSALPEPLESAEINITHNSNAEDTQTVAIPYEERFKENIEYFVSGGCNFLPEDRESVWKECATDLVAAIESALREEAGAATVEFNEMIHGSLNYKTRESGRKDGTGRIDRPW